MIIDALFEFSDAQVLTAISGSGQQVVSELVADITGGNAGETGWGVADADILGIPGKLEWVVQVSTLIAGGNIVCTLDTKAADASIESTGTNIATLTVTDADAAGTIYKTLIPNDDVLRYLGVVYTGSANITGGNVNSWLGYATDENN